MGLMRESLTSSVCLVLAIHFWDVAVSQSPEWIVCDGGPCSCSEPGRRVTCSNVDLLTIQISQYFPSDTSELEMNNNDIEDFPENFFILENLGQLRIMRLYNNPLRSLTREAFNGIPDLEILEIQWADFTSLPPYLLLSVRNLAFFTLSFNPSLESLPDSLLLGTSLSTFKLISNPSLRHLPEALFIGANSNLNFVDILGNSLTSDGIPNNIFDGASTLSMVFIQREELTHIKASWFENLSGNNLQLHITSCSNLQYIEAGAFDGFSNYNSLTIVLEWNDLVDEGIPEDLFVKITPVTVNFYGNQKITREPVACKYPGVTCILPSGVFPDIKL